MNGAPGYVDPHSGLITMGGAIRRFDNFAMKSWLETRTGLPVSVENDANCQRWRKAAEMANFLVLTIGTGIGGAISAKLINRARFRAGDGYMHRPSRPDTILVAIR